MFGEVGNVRLEYHFAFRILTSWCPSLSSLCFQQQIMFPASEARHFPVFFFLRKVLQAKLYYATPALSGTE